MRDIDKLRKRTQLLKKKHAADQAKSKKTTKALAQGGGAVAPADVDQEHGNLPSDPGVWQDETVSDISRGSQVKTGIGKQYNEAAIRRDVAGSVRMYAKKTAGVDRQADLDFVAAVTRILRDTPPSNIDERKDAKEALNKELLQPFRIRVRSEGVGCKFRVAANGSFQLNGIDPDTGESTSFPFVNGQLEVGPWLGKYPSEDDLSLEPVEV